MISRFSVRAEADAQTLMRILNYFAQRDMLPTKVIATVIGSFLDIEVDVAGMDFAERDLISQKLRQLVLVSAVQCTCL
jgi:hypothetical protein